MNIKALIAATHAKRLAAGLCVSFDDESGTERCTRTYASVEEREKGIARLTIRGRNPKIEAAQ